MKSFSIERLLAAYCREMDCQFLINGQAEDPLMIFLPEMFLPVVMAHAQGICYSAIGKPLEFDMVPDPAAIFGLVCRVPPVREDPLSLLRTLCAFEASTRLFGLRPSTYIEVAPVYSAYAGPLSQKLGAEEGVATIWPVATVVPQSNPSASTSA